MMIEAMNKGSCLHKVDVQTVENGDQWNFFGQQRLFCVTFYDYNTDLLSTINH